MEVRLENLIEKIKSEGVETANKQAEEILSKAKTDAAQILEAAKKEAESIKTQAEQTAADFTKNAEGSIAQASRDTILVLKDKVKAIFDAILQAKVAEALDENMLKDSIMKIVSAWAEGKDIAVDVAGVDADKLKSMLVSELKGKSEVEVKLDNRFTSGFKLSTKGNDISYDISDEAIVDALKLFVNPKLAQLLG